MNIKINIEENIKYTKNIIKISGYGVNFSTKNDPRILSIVPLGLWLDKLDKETIISEFDSHFLAVRIITSLIVF